MAGKKSYEIKDHLGNIRMIISDIKEPFETSNLLGNGIGYWRFVAIPKSLASYYPYGKELIEA